MSSKNINKNSGHRNYLLRRIGFAGAVAVTAAAGGAFATKPAYARIVPVKPVQVFPQSGQIGLWPGQASSMPSMFWGVVTGTGFSSNEALTIVEENWGVQESLLTVCRRTLLVTSQSKFNTKSPARRKSSWQRPFITSTGWRSATTYTFPMFPARSSVLTDPQAEQTRGRGSRLEGSASLLVFAPTSPPDTWQLRVGPGSRVGGLVHPHLLPKACWTDGRRPSSRRSLGFRQPPTS